MFTVLFKKKLYNFVLELLDLVLRCFIPGTRYRSGDGQSHGEY